MKRITKKLPPLTHPGSSPQGRSAARCGTPWLEDEEDVRPRPTGPGWREQRRVNRHEKAEGAYRPLRIPPRIRGPVPPVDREPDAGPFDPAYLAYPPLHRLLKHRRRLNRDHLGIVLEVARDITAYGLRLYAGERDSIGGGLLGLRDFDWHSEVPFGGFGVAIDELLVVEREGRRLVRTPYREWCVQLGIEIICPRCRRDLVVDRDLDCPQVRELGLSWEQLRQEREAVGQQRRNWAAAHPATEFPLESRWRPGAHELASVDDLERATQLAREHDYDFDGVHIVATTVGERKRARPRYTVYATGFRTPGGATASPRAWPWPPSSK